MTMTTGMMIMKNSVKGDDLWVQSGAWHINDDPKFPAYHLTKKSAHPEYLKARQHFKGDSDKQVRLERANGGGYNIMLYTRPENMKVKE
jgi:hypothetical protein